MGDVRKKVVLVGIACVLAFVLFEIGVRTVFALQMGPRVLVYGTPFFRNNVEVEAEDTRWVAEHLNESVGYTKYFPNERKIDRDPETGELFDVTINSRGFRGKEIAETKEPGTIRVITLGASSTFGYYNRDETTYPVYLEQQLNANGDQTYEVVNLGIPHLNGEQILALFLAEGLELQPDIVTFYEGRNDSAAGVWESQEPDRSASEEAESESPSGVGESSGLRQRLANMEWLKAAFRKARDTSMALAFVDSFLVENQVLMLDAEYLAEHLEGKSERFVGSVAEIARICSERGITFVAANQQARSVTTLDDTLHGDDPITDVSNLTYSEEVERVRTKLASKGKISYNELAFLAHAELQRDLRDWAESSGVPFVDLIGALDQHRSELVTYVHLSPRGNQLIAAALADAILGLSVES